jgi:hypothetical protein
LADERRLRAFDHRTPAGCAVSTLAKAVTPLQTLRPMATDHLEESPCVC